MTRSKRVLANLFSLTVAEFFSKGLQFLTFTYLADRLNPDGIGVYQYSSAFVAYFITFVGFGFDSIGSREVAKHPEDRSKLVNAITSIRSILVIFALAIYFISLSFWKVSYEEQIVLMIVSANIISNGFLMNWLFIGIEKTWIIAIRQFTTGVLNILGVLIFVKSEEDLVPAMIVLSATLMINTIWMIIYYIKKYDKIKLNIDWVYWKTLSKEAIPLGITFMLVAIYNNINSNLLKWLLPDDIANMETGYFGVPARILLVAILPTIIIQNAFYPNNSKAKTFEERDKIMQKFNLLMLLAGTFVCSIIFIFAEDIIVNAFNKYHESIYILRVLMITAFLMFFNTTYMSPLIAWGYQKFTVRYVGAATITGLIAGFVLIPKYGASGGAYATIVSELTVLVGLLLKFHEVHKKMYLANLIRTVFIALSSSLVAYSLLYLGVHYIIAGILCVIAFIVAVLVSKTVSVSELKGYFKK